MLGALKSRLFHRHGDTKHLGSMIFPSFAWRRSPDTSGALLDLALKVLSSHKIGDIVIVCLLLALLHVLITLSQAAERGQRVRSELVQNSGDELSELLILTITIDRERVRGD